MVEQSDKRIILITGASQGLGRAATLELLKTSHHIIACARSQKALELLADQAESLPGSISLVPLDLKDFPMIDRLGAYVFERWGRLDGLLACAGVLGTLGPLNTVSPKSFAQTIDINLTANWRLIYALDPVLRRSNAGRAVFVTSGVVQHPQAFWGPYTASKAGLEAMIQAYALEVAHTDLKVNLFDPGTVRTSMRGTAMPGEDPMTISSPESIAPEMIRLLAPEWVGHNQRVSI